MNNPTMASSSEKRCLYEVFGISRDCTADEIRSAYKKIVLQRHPDKLVRSGVSEADATASFQELTNAYEVLSDPRERAWYDSHRSQIIFSGSNPSNSSNSIPNLLSFFSNLVFSGYSDTGKGFYKVHGELFDKIYSNELNFAKKLGLGVGAVKEPKEEQLGDNVDGHGSVSDDVIDELSEHFGGGFRFQKQNSEDYGEAQSSEEEGFVDFDNGGASKGLDGSFGSDDDDETSILEAMVSGHKSRKKRTNLVEQRKANAPSTKIYDENDNEEMDFWHIIK